MPGTLPSDRFTSGFKAGSSSDTTRPITGQELIFLERVDETSREQKVRVAVLADIFTDLGFELDGLTETVILSTAAGGSVTLDIKDGLILSRVYGTGTELDPYLVYTAGDLNNVRDDLDANYVQMADIDLTGIDWVPIGHYLTAADNAPFTGNYNGGGFDITGLNIDEYTGSHSIGLFGYATTATISNVNVDGSITSVDTGGNTGLLCGYTTGTITDCSVTGTIASAGISAGGLIGNAAGGTVTITECSADVDIVAGNSTTGPHGVGGLLGYAGGAVSGCSACGSISGDTDADGLRKGGLIGMSTTTITVSACYCDTIIAGDDSGSGTYHGGFIGLMNENATIDNCYSEGAVSGSAALSGGFAGASAGVTEVVSYCYSIGNVTGGTVCGGFCGGLADPEGFDVTVTECFWDKTITAPLVTDEIGATGMTTEQMKIDTTYSNWDTDVWSIINGQYPGLK